MKSLSNQNRQVIYCVGILALFGFMLPYTNWLRNLKERRQLGEATIGQVDAGSFMLKLALLGGARGVAANVLWGRALDLQKAHDWDRLKMTVDQITKLQPHFLRVWSWQGWNLAYNVSVEWDAPEDKYEWIKQGINFLKEGVRKNEMSPDLRWDTAWTYFQKIGTADEAIILRRLYFDDDDEEFRGYVAADGSRQVPRDNYLTAYGWFTNSVALVESGKYRLAHFNADEESSKEGEPQAASMEAPVEYVDRVESRKGQAGDLHFRSMPASSLTRFAAALEKASVRDLPPTFGERARAEWSKAVQAWQEFGDHPFPAHNDRFLKIYLDDAVKPGMVEPRLGWRRIHGDKATYDNQKYWTDRWSDNTHYRYWKDRAVTEMDKRGVAARQLFYEGTRAFKQADYPKAVEKFRDGLDKWASLLESHRTYGTDDLTQQETGKIVLRYKKALTNAGMEPPKSIPFEEVVKDGHIDLAPDPFDYNEIRVASPNDEATSR